MNPGGLPLRRGLISIKDLTKEQIEAVLSESAKMLNACQCGADVNYLDNKIMATLFFEPSTRTRLSFESAMQRLGGGVIGFADPSSSSSMKGESLADTVRIVSSYSDIIVLRHPMEGAASEASASSLVPVINAGDGTGEHPTQALLDLFTIKMEKGRLGKLKVAVVGDLKNGRTVHSLAYALALFGNQILFIAPKKLQVPDEVLSGLSRRYSGMVEKSESLESALDADVIYMTRMQKERFASPDEYGLFANYYSINRKFLSRANDEVILMHPLPRVGEISPEVDGMKNSVYFKQAAYGVPVRMAILNMIIGQQSGIA
jgi:aspartate carbamoyltransferase catalytic subunit